MNTQDIIQLARQHALGRKAAMQSSVELCLADAIKQYDAGNFSSARSWALRSLLYSVGLMHSDYQKALKASRRLEWLEDHL